jgi:hypothetical protein
LLRDPSCRWVRCHIHRDKLAPSQPDSDQNVELDKANGRNYEQIHGRDVRQMIALSCLSSSRPAPDARGMSASLQSRPNLRIAAKRRCATNGHGDLTNIAQQWR